MGSEFSVTHSPIVLNLITVKQVDASWLGLKVNNYVALILLSPKFERRSCIR